MQRTTYLAGAIIAAAVAVGVSACGAAQNPCEEGVQCVEVEREAVSCEFVEPGGAPASVTSDGSGAFTFVVKNFNLQAMGACGTNRACGHARVYVEGCDVAGETHGNTVQLDLGRCGPGEHLVYLVLHDDNHAVYAKDGVALFDVVTVQVTEAMYAASSKHGGKDSDKDSDSDCDSDSDSR